MYIRLILETEPGARMSWVVVYMTRLSMEAAQEWFMPVVSWVRCQRMRP